jgi:coproporphyrinogen III oxidase
MFQQRLFACWLLWQSVSSLTPQTSPALHVSNPSKLDAAVVQKTTNTETITVFHDFCQSLQTKQRDIIQELERMDGSGETFTNDTWGCFADGESSTTATTTIAASTCTRSGGITRVIQGGDAIEKGACSFTLLQQGVLTSERAQAIRSRRQGAMNIQAGDTYSAAALSIVLHSKSPLVPTFRSDVRIFNVETNKGLGMAWFGGGADLTPYYLFEEDITKFHQMYRNVCNQYQLATPGFSYETMKEACDHYFYLPARSEHRGTGGIFFDDLEATPYSKQFVEAVADTWLPSWLPIVHKRRNIKYSDKMRQWQLLRRGRYLEFNLLYDRGVKFGLASANPRVEGIMVSAPPLIAFEYNHVVEEGSEEAKLMEVLKTPRDWVN